MRALIPNSTQIPDVILDHWMARLSGAEFKVVLYVARRTFGFGKESDRISLGQLCTGITKGDGSVLDSGTGLSRSAVKAACASLVSMGVLIKEQKTVGGSDEPDTNRYRLNLYAPLFEGEDPDSSNASETQESGSASGVGQNLAHLGQKSAYLENHPAPVKEVGRKKTHLGQNLAHVGQDSPQGRPKNAPQVGQNLTLQETDQETDLQETATTTEAAKENTPGRVGKSDTGVATTAKPTEPLKAASAVAADSPSAFPEGVSVQSTELLLAAGFSVRDSAAIAAANPSEVVRDQIEWIGFRSVKKNRLGMLRRAIEERWPRPETDDGTQKREQVQATEARQSAKEARRQEIVGGLRSMYSRLESDAPQAFQEFLGYIEEKKAREATRPLIGQSPKRLEAMLAAYEREETRLSLMVEFFGERNAPFSEFDPLLARLKANRHQPLDRLLSSTV